MKKLLFILLYFPFYHLMGQGTLDSLIFNKVNEYRELNGLNKLQWSASAYMVAKNQATYICKIGAPYHDQNIDTLSDFITEPDFDKRFERYNICKDNDNYVFGENLIAIRDTTNELKESLNNIADLAMESWKSSKDHNELLLFPLINYGSIATSIGSREYEYLIDPFTMIDKIIITENTKVYFISLDVYR